MHNSPFNLPYYHRQTLADTNEVRDIFEARVLKGICYSIRVWRRDNNKLYRGGKLRTKDDEASPRLHLSYRSMTVTSSQVRQSWLNFLTVMINSCIPGWNTISNGGENYREEDLPINEKFWSKEEALENAQIYLAQMLSYVICRNRNCVDYKIQDVDGRSVHPEVNIQNENKSSDKSNSSDYLWNYMYRNKTDAKADAGLEDIEPICLPSFQGIKIHLIIFIAIHNYTFIYTNVRSFIH